MPALTKRDEAHVFIRSLKNSRTHFRDPPRYTNLELLALATEFLHGTSWTTFPDELVKETRKVWSEKGQATKVKNKKRKEKLAKKNAEIEKKNRQMTLQF